METQEERFESLDHDPWIPRTASMQEFMRIRRIIARAMNIDANLIQPKTPIGAIIPASQRDAVMKLINCKKLDNLLRCHRAHQGSHHRWILGLGELTCGLILGAMCLVQPWVLVIMTIPITIIAGRIMGRTGSIHWPACLETMHDLALSQTRYSRADAKAGLWPRSEIAAKVRWIVAYQSGLRFEEVTEETSLVDLDCC